MGTRRTAIGALALCSIACSASLFAQADGPATPPSTVLLITSEDLAEAWQPFADWKTSIGKHTTVVTVASITAAAEDGITVQEAIRRRVQEHVRGGIRWLILGGDSLRYAEDGSDQGHVPGGPLTVHRREPRGIPTDIVYLSPTPWDADGDGIHGEWEDDREAIHYPDGSVGLGRIPVRTPADVAAFTDKVIAYESQYPTTPFAERMVYTCTDAPAYPKVRNSWDGYLHKVWDGEVARFFADETPWDGDGAPGSHALSAENLVALINEGHHGKLHLHGHGHLPSWVLEGSRFGAQQVAALRNEGHYPLITTVSCNTGEYDAPRDPSIVEAMLRQPKAGSVAVVAPIRTGKPHFHSRADFRLMVTEGKLDGTTQTMTRYWCGGLGDGLTTGESLMRAKAEMATDAARSPGYHLCICELNLLGDPTLDMRPSAPRVAEASLPERLILGTTQQLQVVTDAPGSTVCLWKKGEAFAVVTAEASGKASITLPAELSAGDATVSVSGRGLNARRHTLTFCNPN